MRWDPSHESSDVDDRRGEVRGGGVPLLGAIALGSRFGWKGVLIALLVIGGLMYGGQMCGSSGGPAPAPAPAPSRSVNEPKRSPGGDDLAKFVGFVFDDVQGSWAKQMPGYQKTRLTLFTDAIDSACGTATAAVGPFYCPIDHKVYIDLAFYDQLHRQFGASGDFAQAYVIAHEVGHHVQNQLGLLGKGEVDSIDTELQADCLAGAWARDADARGEVEVGDVDEALHAASAIGDDTIQRKTTGRVQPESWTHGSSEQRSNAFRAGVHGGAQACGLK